mgnify:CR=1 FL=1
MSLTFLCNSVPGGDLFTYLIKHTRLDAPEAKWILYQLLLALEYLHDDLGIAHRDVKLENVVLAFTCPGTGGRFPKAQLADFGQAKEAASRFKSLQGASLSMLSCLSVIGFR